MSEIVRLAGVLVAAVLALAAAAAAMVPLALKQHRLDTPQVFTGGTTLMAAPIAGGVPHDVLTLHGQWDFPVATADGKAVLLERPTLTRTALWRIPLDGSAPTRISDLTTFSQLAWSPDRTRYVAFGNLSTVMFRADGTRIRTLAHEQGGGGASWNGDFISAERQTHPYGTREYELDVWHSNGSLAWRREVPGPMNVTAVARDGREVAVVRLHDIDLVTPHGSRVVATDSMGITAPAWTPDGRSLVYWNTHGSLVEENVLSGAAHVVAQGTHTGAGGFSVSPNGKTVYLTRLNQAVSIPK